MREIFQHVLWGVFLLFFMSSLTECGTQTFSKSEVTSTYDGRNTGMKSNHKLNAGPCDNKPCKNEGTCAVTAEGFECSCVLPYSGPTCETSPCEYKPCRNEGTCIVTAEGFECGCVLPFSGPTCEISPCENKPCQNDGMCIVTAKGFECNCVLPYSGPTCEIEQICDCGNSSYTCDRDESGRKICNCFSGYSQLGGICSDCSCGKNTVNCFFDRNGRKFCICRDGFAQRNGNCSKICKSNADCLNGGACSLDVYNSFCNCKPPYTGDRCEVNEICNNMKDTCNAIGADCHYVHSIKQGFCLCSPNKTFNKDLKICEDKFEFTSIFFVIMCSVTVLLLLSIVIIIVSIRKFRKKLDRDVKTP